MGPNKVLHAGGNARLREVKPCQIDRLVVLPEFLNLFVQILDDNPLINGNGAKRLDNDLPIHPEDLLALAYQRFIGIIDMPVICKLVENIEYSCLGPQF